MQASAFSGKKTPLIIILEKSSRLQEETSDGFIHSGLHKLARIVAVMVILHSGYCSWVPLQVPLLYYVSIPFI